VAGRLSSSVEAQEKVPKQIPGQDAEKSDLMECAAINNSVFERGQVTPQNRPLIEVIDFFYRLVMQGIAYD